MTQLYTPQRTKSTRQPWHLRKRNGNYENELLKEIHYAEERLARTNVEASRASSQQDWLKGACRA